MHTEGGVHVVASEHAALRALGRVPVLRGCSMQEANYWVERTVGRALRDRRMARRCPVWCVREWEDGYRRRARASSESGHLRFVWNEDETASMLVRRRLENGERLWVVVTVLVRTVPL